MAVLLLVLLAAMGGPAQTALDLEREAREIEALLIAPCCFRQQVSVHQSEAAEEVRRDVRARLAAGEARQQILDAYVARYGRRILAEPPTEGFGLTLYVVPVVILLAGLGLVGFAIRSFTGRGSTVPPAEGLDALPARTPTPDIEARLDDELRDLD